MRRVGQARRRDRLEPQIVSALRAIGIEVWYISAAGFPDLMTYSRGIWLPIEVKKPRGKLTQAQIETRTRAPFPVVESVVEALSLFGVMA